MSAGIRHAGRLLAMYRHYRSGATVVPAPPPRLWLEISSRCNLRCTVCPNKDLAAGEKGDMGWPLFSQAVAEARPFTCEVNLHHRGETLLHPEAGRFIRHAVAAGLTCRLHTNGTLLQGKVADELLESGLQRLSVSLDGFSAEAYERNRPGASFDHVTGNIAAFLEKRRALRRRVPRLTVEVMELASGPGWEALRRGFAASFRRLGLDELAGKKPHNWAGLLGAPDRRAAISPCTFPWSALVVFFDGRVVPCPQDFFGRLLLGNAGKQSLLDIWNGPAMQALRRAHAAGDLAAYPTCQDCDRIRRPTLAGVPAEFLGRFLRRRMT